MCVHVCVSGGLQVWGGERRAGATESQNVLAVELGRGSSWPLCCLFWGNHNAEAREGCEQQICWTDRALEGRTGSLEMTQFLSELSGICCVTVDENLRLPDSVQQLRKARRPAAGPLGPVSAAYPGPQQEQGSLHPPEDEGLRVGAKSSRTGGVDHVSLGPLGFGDFSPRFAFAFLPEFSLSWHLALKH